jgi:uncharacterized membrane protein YukC
MPLPIDLQVLFTKANEHSENIARNINAVEHIRMTGVEKIHQQSVNADTQVEKTEKYSREFTKVNPDLQGSGHQNQKEENPEKEKDEASSEPADHRSHLKEDGTGSIIDVVD